MRLLSLNKGMVKSARCLKKYERSIYWGKNMRENFSDRKRDSGLLIHVERFNYDHMLKLMAIYRDEWMYRDKDNTSSFWRYALISLVVTFLPNIATEFRFSNIPLFKQIPQWVFSVAGILCSLFAMYLILANGKRIEYLDNAYKKIMGNLPKRYRIRLIKEDTQFRNRIYRFRLIAPFCITVFSIIIALAIANIFWTVTVMS